MFQFPADVDGWLTEPEGAELYRLAAGRRVVEVGAYCGRSTVCLAQSAEHVVSIDPFDGRGTPRPRDTFAEFTANMDRYGLADKVHAYEGTFADVAPRLAGKPDFVFIDGAHDPASVRADLELASALVAAGGLIACHDYGPGGTPGVTAAVDDYAAFGAEVVARQGSLVALTAKPGYTARRPDAVVFLGSPGRPGGAIHRGAARSIYGWTYHTRPGRTVQVIRAEVECSVLPMGFDQLWAMALNHHAKGEVTHFAMHHDDIACEPDWLGTLLDESDRLKADVVSAVVPLKDARGLTSTARDTTGDPWSPRRYSLAEVFAEPETFTHPAILLNSGVWIADLSRPWVHAESDGVLACSFHQRNQIRRDPDGLWQPVMRSEDWEFSRAARAAGATGLYATRKVGLWHGEPHFHNRNVWGTCATDPVHADPAGG